MKASKTSGPTTPPKKTSSLRTTSISIVGSGNVATHLSLALHNTGCEIRQILSRSLEHAQLLARRVDAHAICQWERLDGDADMYLLCVPDDALYDLALDLRLPDALVVHTSGATPLSVLHPISKRCGVVWSPQTFVRDIAMDYSQLPLCIEGSDPASERQLLQLFSRFTQHLHVMNSEARRQTHLAAVMVSNFVGALNATAHDYLRSHGIDPSLLRPLAEQTLHKWDYGNLWLQQTGPAARRDEKTLAAQRRMLADEPALLELYNVMTDLIQRNT